MTRLACRYFCMVMIAVFLFGCASRPEGPVLELKSVMDMKKEKEARRAQIEAEAAAIPPETLKKEMEEEVYKGQEITLLKLPSLFRKLDEQEMAVLRTEAPEEMSDLVEAVWQNDETGVRVLAGKVDMDADRVRAMKRDAFIAKTQQISDAFDEYYKSHQGSQASLKLRDEGAFIVTSVVGKFIRDNTWYTHRRYFYFFRPEYRFVLLVGGPDEALLDLFPQIEESIDRFESLLRRLYPEGISFSENQS